MEAQDEDFGDQLPIGYRFTPTDEELVTHYLINKVFSNPIHASVFHEVDASQLYSKPPNTSVQFSSGEREWFFFIRKDTNFDKENKAIRIVEGGRGFWRSYEEKPLIDTNENVLALKIHLIYFSGLSGGAKKTHWRMDEYRLPVKSYTRHDFKEEWAVGRLRRGRDFNFGF